MQEKIPQNSTPLTREEQYREGEERAKEYEQEDDGEVLAIQEARRLEKEKQQEMDERYQAISKKIFPPQELTKEDLDFLYFVYPHKIIDKYVGYDSGEDVDPSGAISYDTREILYERNQNHDMRLIFGDELSEEELEAKIKEREEQGFNEATKIFNQFLS